MAMTFLEAGFGPTPALFNNRDLNLIESSFFVRDEIDFNFKGFSRGEIGRELGEHGSTRLLPPVYIDPTTVKDDTFVGGESLGSVVLDLESDRMFLINVE